MRELFEHLVPPTLRQAPPWVHVLINQTAWPGLGSLLRGRREGLAQTLIALAGFAVACGALSLAPGFWPFVALSIPLGFASASFQSVNTVVVQQATEPSMQGRVMALHQMAWFGTTPIGALLVGWIIQMSSPRVPFALGGLAALLCSAAVLRSRHSHQGSH